MKLNALLLLGLVDLSSAWTTCLPHSVAKRQQRNRFSARGRSLGLTAPENLNEFDHLLHENDITTSLQSASPASSRRVIKLGGDGGEKTVVLTSSTAAAAPVEEALEGGEDAGAYDPYADVDYSQQMGKIQAVQDQSKPSMESRFKQMDLQDIIITLIIPAIVSFAGLRWGFNKVSGKVIENAELTLDSFASEMVYHDGNEEEMRMCFADYGRQLLWMGPKKNDAMIKRYLQAYAKKKTVSPQSIRTLSYVFALFKLSEDRASQVLVELCKAMGEDKISSAGKILFFGSRILKSPEGQAGLVPIKDMIKGTYRDEAVAETLVETSQQAIGEAAYRSTVLSGGKKQKKLTAGWEVLGLDKDTATRIFEEEKEEGFLSERERMYGGQTTKYDKKGNVLDDEGKLENGEDPEDDEDDDDSPAASTSNVYSCGECGYTLFIAKGREFKFYGDDFKCPECGAKKDKFAPADLED